MTKKGADQKKGLGGLGPSRPPNYLIKVTNKLYSITCFTCPKRKRKRKFSWCHLQIHLWILDPKKDIADSWLETDRTVRIKLNFKHGIVTWRTLNKVRVICLVLTKWQVTTISSEANSRASCSMEVKHIDGKPPNCPVTQLRRKLMSLNNEFIMDRTTSWVNLTYNYNVRICRLHKATVCSVFKGKHHESSGSHFPAAILCYSRWKYSIV